MVKHENPTKLIHLNDLSFLNEFFSHSLGLIIGRVMVQFSLLAITSCKIIALNASKFQIVVVSMKRMLCPLFFRDLNYCNWWWNIILCFFYNKWIFYIFYEWKIYLIHQVGMVTKTWNGVINKSPARIIVLFKFIVHILPGQLCLSLCVTCGLMITYSQR